MRDEVWAALEVIRSGRPAHELESQTLDFKTVGRSLADTLKDLAEASACFANSDGGTIVVGVKDRPGGQGAFVGQDLDHTQLVARIYELTDPALVVMIEEQEVEGALLSVITVPASPDVHQVRGRATERVGDSCRPMTANRIAAAQADKRGDDWSAKDSGVSLEERSPSAEEAARDMLAAAADPERQSWARLPWPDLCRRLGVAVDDRLTRAGELLFADSPRHHAQYVRRAPNAGLLTANEAIGGPGLLAIRRVIELVETRIERTAILTHSGQQLLIGDLPGAAIREVLVNAFMHRDHRDSAMIQVEHAESRLRVTSPGGFPPGVTVDNLLTVSSRCRNLTLAQAIRNLGLAESAGVGVDRMYASMTALGHRPPAFAADESHVEAVLHGGPPNEPITRFVQDLPEHRRGDPDTLLVLTYLLTHRTTDARTMSLLLQKGVDETEAVLMALSAPGDSLIERTAKSARSARGEYRLTGEAVRALGHAVSYRARSGDDSDRKIIAVVQEMGEINGRVVQTMFDVQPATASRMLSDLVDRRVLVKTSTATRGPSVKYGPGERFPAKRSRNRAVRDDPTEPERLPLDGLDGEGS